MLIMNGVGIDDVFELFNYKAISYFFFRHNIASWMWDGEGGLEETWGQTSNLSMSNRYHFQIRLAASISDKPTPNGENINLKKKNAKN